MNTKMSWKSALLAQVTVVLSLSAAFGMEENQGDKSFPDNSPRVQTHTVSRSSFSNTDASSRSSFSNTDASENSNDQNVTNGTPFGRPITPLHSVSANDLILARQNLTHVNFKQRSTFDESFFLSCISRLDGELREDDSTPFQNLANFDESRLDDELREDDSTPFTPLHSVSANDLILARQNLTHVNFEQRSTFDESFFLSCISRLDGELREADLTPQHLANL